MIIGIICTILSVVGLIGFFTGNIILIVIGGVSAIIENLVGIFSGEQKDLSTVILAIIIGCIYASFYVIPLWLGALIGLCFESVIMGVLGWGAIVLMMLKKS